jgi:CheY-like chemotaxis protein
MSRVFRIVLIEDNPGDVYLFQKALERAEVQFQNTVFADGSQAMAFANRPCTPASVPDLILLDLNLPKNGGLEILQAIRKNQTLASAPVVVTSSSSSPRDQRCAEDLGIEKYLSKPPDLEDFLKLGFLLKSILRKHDLT